MSKMTPSPPLGVLIEIMAKSTPTPGYFFRIFYIFLNARQ